MVSKRGQDFEVIGYYEYKASLNCMEITNNFETVVVGTSNGMVVILQIQNQNKYESKVK
jgi:hypothetical protein